MLIGTQIQKKSTFRSKISVPISLRRRPPIVFTVEMNIAVNIGRILRNIRFQKMSIYRSKLAVPVS